jgi:ketosteroid isomerase-like protein
MRSTSTPNVQLPIPKEIPRARSALGVGRWRLGVCALLVVCAVASLTAQRRVQSAQQILEQLERDWVDAMQANDVAFVNSVLAPEYIATHDDGTRSDKTRELQMVERFNAQVDEWIVEDFTIKVYGETAVVWFTHRMTGPVQGKPTQIVVRYMDVFVMRDGKWLCVGSQSTKVAPR